MRRLVLLDSVRTDLLDILDHVAGASGSVSLAVDFVTRLRRRCAQLATLPGIMGRPRPELRSDMRSSVFKGYVIFFRDIDVYFDEPDEISP